MGKSSPGGGVGGHLQFPESSDWVQSIPFVKNIIRIHFGWAVVVVIEGGGVNADFFLKHFPPQRIF